MSTKRDSSNIPVAVPTVNGDCLLLVERVSVGFESRVVLKEISVAVPRRGILGVLGPAGVGKSTFLRTLGRWNDALPSFWAHGNVWLDGQELLKGTDGEHVRKRVALLMQKARLYTATILENVIADIDIERPLRLGQKRELARESLAPLGLWDKFEPLLNNDVLSLPLGVQRKLSMARLLAGGAACLLADEPLRDISDEEARDLSEFIERVAEGLPVVIVTHDQREARELCDTICLISAGKVIEVTPAEEFFTRPKTDLARTFLEFGNCWPAEEDSDKGSESPVAAWEPQPEEKVPRPGGFHWVVAGRLGGMQQPGLLRDMEQDLTALANLGCRMLVSLTEEGFDAESLSRFGITSEHFPIADMSVPTLLDAEKLCERISLWMDKGITTIFHCKAGLGRTGTLLACVLVYRGENPVRAIEQVRAINPFYIQSRAQLDFISEFANHVSRPEPIEGAEPDEPRDDGTALTTEGESS